MLLHGLHGDLSRMTTLGEMFARRGYSVLLPPFRGHDGHPCPVTTGGVEEVFDAVGAVLAAGGMGYADRSMVLYGSSMGAAVAVKASAVLAGVPLAGVVAHACYTSFFDAARLRLGPFRTAVLKALLPRGPRRGLEDLRPGDYLRPAPAETTFVFLAGTRDSVCPPEMGSSLADIPPRGVFVALGGAGHPKWEHPELSGSWQMEKAIEAADGLVRGEAAPGGTLFIDEECRVRHVPRSRRGQQGARSAR